MKTDDLLALLAWIAPHDRPRSWNVRHMSASDRTELAGSVLDPVAASDSGGWVADCDGVPVLAFVGGRLHAHGMSTPIDPNPWLAVGQLLRAIDAVIPGIDSRPSASRG
jgi:hypothetical protein